MNKKIARVFPRKTNASPIDEYSFFDVPGMFLPEIEEVHVSVSFTYDLRYAFVLAAQWEHIAPVKIGGPATGVASGEFVPGMYLKKGFTITSRGCPNRCWFCSVWGREPILKELKIKEGNILLDDNLLACSEKHIRNVFEMLGSQKESAQFKGGLEAKLLKEWHIDLLLKLKPKPILYFAYDEPDDLEPLIVASKLLRKSGIIKKGHTHRCYVLVGYPLDTFKRAEQRLFKTVDLGFFPMSMLYKNKNGTASDDWIKFNTQWANAFKTGVKIKKRNSFSKYPR